MSQTKGSIEDGSKDQMGQNLRFIEQKYQNSYEIITKLQGHPK